MGARFQIHEQAAARGTFSGFCEGVDLSMRLTRRTVEAPSHDFPHCIDDDAADKWIR
jgi:hypothetical protein